MESTMVKGAEPRSDKLKKASADEISEAYATVGAYYTHFNKLLDRRVIGLGDKRLRLVCNHEIVKTLMQDPDGVYRALGLTGVDHRLIDNGVVSLLRARGYSYNTYVSFSSSWAYSFDRQTGKMADMQLYPHNTPPSRLGELAVLNYFFVHYLFAYCNEEIPAEVEDSIRPTVELSLDSLKEFNHINNTLLKFIGQWEPVKKEA